MANPSPPRPVITDIETPTFSPTTTIDCPPLNTTPPTDKDSLEHASSVSEDAKYIVNFLPDDPRNPINFTKHKKWKITVVVSFFTVLVSTSATSFGMGYPSMTRDLHAAQSEATLGLSLYCLGFGVFPLLTSAFSEEFGRQPMYYVSISGFLLVHLMVALVPNIQLVVFGRFLQGAFGSTGATMVAGTIADVWERKDRGVPMCFWSSIAFAGNGIGAMMGGWTELNPKLEWKWIQWIHLIIGGVYFIFVLLTVEETRPAVILLKMAEKLRKQTGDLRYQPFIAGGKQPTLRERFYLSCTRPIYFLFTEPIVLACSVWIGFAWGVYFGMIQSIPGIFRALHNFNSGQIGTVYSAMAIGGTIGFFTNFYQEALYRRNVARRGHEARLYMAMVAGFLFPASMFTFAWSSTPKVHWVVLVLALIVYIWSVFIIFLTIFTYLADGYGTYASSALSGQSLFRNIMSTIFPLFSDRLFSPTKGLGYRWANTLFASVGLLLAPIPIILFMYGPRIWARSKCKEAI